MLMQFNKNEFEYQNEIFEPAIILNDQVIYQHETHPPHLHPPTPPERHLDQDNQMFSNNSQLKFYQEYKKIYTVSHHLAVQKKRQTQLYEELIRRTKALDDKMKDTKDIDPPKKQPTSEQNRLKRARRTAEQIQKRHKCSVEYCQRLYGSQGSLQQHIKLKHPELYKRQYSNSQQNSRM